MGNPLHSAQGIFDGRQHNRILRLSFPHKDGPSSHFLANKLEADEGLSRDFDFTVEILSDNANLALEALQGKMLCVELVRKGGELRYFCGYIFSFRMVKTDGKIAFYEAKLGPWLKGTSKNLLRVAISALRCSPYLRTVALLLPNWRRSLRFLKVPFKNKNTGRVAPSGTHLPVCLPAELAYAASF